MSDQTNRPRFFARALKSVRKILGSLIIYPSFLTMGAVARTTSSGSASSPALQDDRQGQAPAEGVDGTTYQEEEDPAASAETEANHSIFRRRRRHDFLGMFLKLRNRHVLLLDAMALLLIPTLTMILLTDGLSWWANSSRVVIIYSVFAMTIQLAVFHRMGLYSHYWQYAGTAELTHVVLTVGISTAIMMVLYATIPVFSSTADLADSRALPVVAGLLAFMAVGGNRFGLSGIYRWLRTGTGEKAPRRLLIVGAGEAGKLVVRETRTNAVLRMDAVAFVDDDLRKVGTQIEGLPVIGTLDIIPQLAREMDLHDVIVAIPSAPLGRQQEIINLCKKNGINVAKLPGLFEILAGYKTISPIPQIDPNILLGRQPVTIDQTDIATTHQGAKVLVTGAGGSIGSELCRQIALLDPAELILLGHGENSIFEIGLDLNLSFPDLVQHSFIVDVRDAHGVDWAIEKCRPDIIFHAAAHKHVPYMEESASEAITNNVQGTWNVLRAAQRYDVPRLVLISSDKAVNPTSVMGATKRIAELLVKAAASESGRAYMAVRFGNVLGSRGSVVPVFQWQIHAGGPLKITHPDMRRYFMTIPEAVQLVLQTATLGKSGEIFTLDMGEQVRILDLATSLIKLSGLKVGRDIDIVFSGVRPGEKMQEELFLKDETYVRKNQKLFVAVNGNLPDNKMLTESVAQLVDLAQGRQHDQVVSQMQSIIPDYRPQGRWPRSQSSEIRLPSGLNSQKVRV